MRVAALQFDVRRGDVAANLATVEAALAVAAERGIRLVVLPEMWPTSFVEPQASGAADWLTATTEALARVAELSREHGIVIAGSSFAADPAGGRPRNRLHVFEGGEPVLRYDKVHLFSPTAEPAGFSHGDRPPATVETAVGALSGVVCYDLRFGPLMRVPFLAGAEVLVVPAQWPRTRAGQWRALVLGRAVENQCLVVATNRTGEERVGRRGKRLAFPGNSLVVGPSGEILAEGRGAAGLVEAQVDRASVRRVRREVPVARDQRQDLYAAWGRPQGGSTGA